MIAYCHSYVMLRFNQRVVTCTEEKKLSAVQHCIKKSGTVIFTAGTEEALGLHKASMLFSCISLTFVLPNTK